MRIVINIDPINECGKRLRIRTRCNTTNRDRKHDLRVQNAVADFYRNIVATIRDGCDTAITDFIDEGGEAVNIIDEIYYEQNPEQLEQDWRDYLAENGLTEDEFSMTDYYHEM